MSLFMPFSICTIYCTLSVGSLPPSDQKGRRFFMVIPLTSRQMGMEVTSYGETNFSEKRRTGNFLALCWGTL